MEIKSKKCPKCGFEAKCGDKKTEALAKMQRKIISTIGLKKNPNARKIDPVEVARGLGCNSVGFPASLESEYENMKNCPHCDDTPLEDVKEGE